MASAAPFFIQIQPPVLWQIFPICTRATLACFSGLKSCRWRQDQLSWVTTLSGKNLPEIHAKHASVNKTPPKTEFPVSFGLYACASFLASGVNSRCSPFSRMRTQKKESQQPSSAQGEIQAECASLFHRRRLLPIDKPCWMSAIDESNGWKWF